MENKTTNYLLGILTAAVGLLSIFNFFSGFVGGIWLLILGNWQYVVGGLLLSFLMPFGYSIASLPALALVPLIGKFAERKQTFPLMFFGFLGSLFQNGIALIWVIYVFNFVIANADESNYIPLLIWGYSVTLGPLGYMASKESSDSHGTTIGVIFAMTSYAMLTITTLFFKYDLAPNYILLAIFSALPLLLLNKYLHEA